MENINARQQVKPVIIALAVYGVAAVVASFPLAFRLSDSLAEKYVDGNLPFGDVNHFLWYFWWLKKSLLELHSSPFFTTYQTFPQGLDLTLTTYSPLYGFISLSLQPVCTLICVYNIFFLASLTLCGFFTFLLIREVGGDWGGALVGGFVFSYSPFFFFHYAHLNLISFYWIPLTLLFAVRIIKRKSSKYVFLSSLGVAATALTGWYNFIFLVLILVFWLGSALWNLGKEKKFQYQAGIDRIVLLITAILAIAASFSFTAVYILPVPLLLYLIILLFINRNYAELNAHARNCILFIIVTVLILLPYVYPMLTKYAEASSAVQRPLESKIYFSAEPLSYLLPSFAWKWVWDLQPARLIDFYGSHFPRELQYFPGFICLSIIAIFAIFMKGKVRNLFWLISAGIFAIFSLGPVFKFLGPVRLEFLPYDFMVLPGAFFHRWFVTEGIRVYARFGIVVLFCLSVFVGSNIKISHLRFNLSGHKYGIVVAALCIAALAEKVDFPMNLSSVKVPEVFYKLREINQGGAAVAVPFTHNSTYLYLQTIHEHPLVNAYSSREDEATRAFYERLYFFKLLEIPPEPIPPDIGANELYNLLLGERRNLRIDFFFLHKQYLDASNVEKMMKFFKDFLDLPVAYEDKDLVIFGDITLVSKEK